MAHRPRKWCPSGQRALSVLPAIVLLPSAIVLLQSERPPAAGRRFTEYRVVHNLATVASPGRTGNRFAGREGGRLEPS